MQALPYATQLLGRLGAEVVKIESPGTGDLGRSASPAMTDPDGRPVGATFLRNNLSKRSIVIDLKQPAGRDLVLRLAPRFDVVAENFRAGAIERLGLGYDDVAAAHPAVVYLSISGFGHRVPAGTPESPYADWPALASIVEAMSGAYEFKRPSGQPPIGSPMGGLGDIVTGLFAVIGTQAALRQRDRTGQGAARRRGHARRARGRARRRAQLLVHGDADGHALAGDPARLPRQRRLVHAPGAARRTSGPTWPAPSAGRSGPTTRASPRPKGWLDHLESDIRPALESWASTLTKREACDALNAAGLVAGPVANDEEVVADPHLAGRHMLVEHPRTDGVAQPVLIPGLPVKFAEVAEGPETRVPWLGEHTDEVLAGELGLNAGELAALRADGVIGP